MNRKIPGAILLSSAGIVLALGTAGAQIANALVLAGFLSGRQSGLTPPGPQSVYPHWLVIVTALALGAAGIRFLYGQRE